MQKCQSQDQDPWAPLRRNPECRYPSRIPDSQQPQCCFPSPQSSGFNPITPSQNETGGKSKKHKNRKQSRNGKGATAQGDEGSKVQGGRRTERANEQQQKHRSKGYPKIPSTSQSATQNKKYEGKMNRKVWGQGGGGWGILVFCREAVKSAKHNNLIVHTVKVYRVVGLEGFLSSRRSVLQGRFNTFLFLSSCSVIQNSLLFVKCLWRRFFQPEWMKTRFQLSDVLQPNRFPSFSQSSSP